MLFDFIKSRKFRKAIEHALRDGVLSDREIESLDQLQKELDLPRSRAQKEYVRLLLPLAERMVKRQLDRIRKARRCSPADIRELEDIGKQLKVGIDIDYESLKPCQNLWRMENDPDFELEPIGADVRLGRNEECYHHCSAEWAQMKKTRQLHGFVGSSIGFRVSKNVTLRFGGGVPVASTNEGLQTVSLGELFVTNKKLLFLGEKRSTTITFGRIARWSPWDDAIEVEKNTGKPDVFGLDPINVEYVCMLLERLN